MLAAAATIGLLIFAGWQTFLVRRSTNAAEGATKAARDAVIAAERYVELTKEMSEASKQSARAAELALNAERPYVFLEPMSIETQTDTIPDAIGILLPQPFKRPMKTVTTRWLSIQLRNRGKGIAIIEKIYVRPCIASRTDDPKIGKGQILPISQRVIGVSESVRSGTTVPDKVVPPVFENYIRRFAVVGYVRYRDVYERRYKSTFGYFYRPSTLLTPQLTFFVLAGEKHNRIYEER